MFTEIATSTPAKATADTANIKKPNLGSMVAKGITEGAAENIATEAINSVLPTKAAIHQEASDAVRKIPGVGDAIDIGQKASYAAHLGKLFGNKKKPKRKINNG